MRADRPEYVQGQAKIGHVQGRLRRHLPFWRTFVRWQLILTWLASGYPLDFAGAPPPPRHFSNQPSCFQSYGPLGSGPAFIDTALTELLASGAAVEDPHIRVCHPLGIVEQKGKLRLIYDARYVNSFLKKTPFRYETLDTLPDILKPFDFLFTVDVSSAYHHVELHNNSQPYVGFSWRNRRYRYRVCPFGLQPIPYVYTKIMKELVGYWRRQGLRVLPYLDDALFAVAPAADGSTSHLSQLIARILHDYAAAGLTLQPAKLSNILPGTFAHLVDFLGYEIDTCSGRLAVRSARWARLQATFRQLRSLHPRPIPAKLIASAAGRASSTYHATGDFSRLGVRPLTNLLRPLTDELSPLFNRWRTKLTLSPDALTCVDLWLSTSRLQYTAPIWTPSSLPRASISALYGPEESEPSLRAFTDAGAFGWGGHCGSIQARGYLTPEQRRESSTWRELWAIFQFLTTLFAARSLPSHLALFTDSDNARSILRYGSSHLPLQTLALRIFLLCRQHQLILLPRWIPRRFNDQADALAGIVDLDDWKLHPSLFTSIDKRWGPHSADGFASDLNRQSRGRSPLPFFSMFWCPGTSGVDAFLQDWSSHNLWLNPPFKLIGKVLRKLRADAARATLIVPAWPNSHWWPCLCPDGKHLLPEVSDWIDLPLSDDLFLPGFLGSRSGIRRPNYRIFALRLDFRSTAPITHISRCTSSSGSCPACRAAALQAPTVPPRRHLHWRRPHSS